MESEMSDDEIGGGGSVNAIPYLIIVFAFLVFLGFLAAHS
jgi:hypothetical protein